jgi:hypothetical protein
LLVATERERIQAIIDNLTSDDTATIEEIQEAGADLATKLGQVLETQIRVGNIRRRLENLQ